MPDIKLLITNFFTYCFKKNKYVDLYSNMSDKQLQYGYFPITELYDTVSSFICDEFKFFPSSIEPTLDELTQLLREDLNFYMEYPYVEKVYRDSFYNYYSTKHNSTIRNCARIAFFSNEVMESDFRDKNSFGKIQENFLGYITIRPTLPNLIGKTMLSPMAYRENRGIYCLTKANVLINGVRLDIRAFPHSSQDGETITCAETTIWSVMEYFGLRYPDYRPVLPSKIISALSNYSYERQLPSRGLTSEQISFALREFGFGTRLYALRSEDDPNGASEAYPEIEFKRLLGYYIESGIPVIAAVENDTLGHALVVMGRENINHEGIDLTSYEPQNIDTRTGAIELYDYADFLNNYVVIDDNMPPYNSVPFSNPTANYTDPQFDNCKIKNFIAPLYHKVYLEAGGARELMLSYLESFEHELPGNKIILKLFFTSSRSFKAELNERIDLGDDATELILNLTMPKFVWIGVFTNPKLLNESKANGMVVVDATETNIEDARILMVSPNRITTYDSQAELDNKYSFYYPEIKTFNIFANNLKDR